MTKPGLSKEAVQGRLAHLPSHSQVVTELLASFSSEEVDVDAVVRQLARDQALAARVLRVANSSFYGLQKRVGTIPEAVTVLGFRAVRSIVLAVSLASAFRPDLCPGFDAPAYLRHGVATALAARVLAPGVGINPDLAFIGGLLHDIGQLALASNFPEHYAHALAKRQREDIALIDAEQQALGLDHAEVGGMLANLWNFPDTLREAVAEHHTPNPAAGKSLANLIYLANITAHALGLSRMADESVPPLDDEVWEALGLNWQNYEKALPEIVAGFEEACQVITF